MVRSLSLFRINKILLNLFLKRNDKKKGMFGSVDDDTVGRDDGRRREMQDSETNALKGSILARGWEAKVGGSGEGQVISLAEA